MRHDLRQGVASRSAPAFQAFSKRLTPSFGVFASLSRKRHVEPHHSMCPMSGVQSSVATAVPKMPVDGRCEDVIFFDGVFFEPSLTSIFFAP